MDSKEKTKWLVGVVALVGSWYLSGAPVWMLIFFISILLAYLYFKKKSSETPLSEKETEEKGAGEI